MTVKICRAGDVVCITDGETEDFFLASNVRSVTREWGADGADADDPITRIAFKDGGDTLDWRTIEPRAVAAAVWPEFVEAPAASLLALSEQVR